jgi:hypothetical protein
MLVLWLAPVLALRGKISGDIKTSLTVPGTDLKRCIPHESDLGAGLVA